MMISYINKHATLQAGLLLLQDIKKGTQVAFKVSTKPLVVLNEDSPHQPPVGSAAFNEKMMKNSWEYR